MGFKVSIIGHAVIRNTFKEGIKCSNIEGCQPQESKAHRLASYIKCGVARVAMVPHRLPICTPSRLMQGLDLSDDNDDGDNTTTKEEEEEEVVENVLVLYGSQSHVSRGVAEEIHCNLPRCLSPDSIGIMTNCDANPPRVRPILCSLDEFLDDGAPWTRHVVIVVSSFGNGGAPSNAKRFRKFCDAILSQPQQQQQENATTTATTATAASKVSTRKVKEDNDHDKPGNTNTVSPILLGIQYHLLALGDSCWWKTFLKNPTVLDQTLQALGATRVGEMGVADANEKSKQHPQPQKVAIAKWTQGLWYQLADAIVEQQEEEEQPANPVDLESCSRETMRLYKNLVKTTKRKKKNKKNNPRDW